MISYDIIWGSNASYDAKNASYDAKNASYEDTPLIWDHMISYDVWPFWNHQILKKTSTNNLAFACQKEPFWWPWKRAPKCLKGRQAWRPWKPRALKGPCKRVPPWRRRSTWRGLLPYPNLGKGRCPWKRKWNSSRRARIRTYSLG